MFKGWKLVARLGRKKGLYPHVLVDPFNWCLRLGPKKARDDKFYSSLSTLLVGLVEHLARRRMLSEPVADSIDDLRKGLRSALKTAAKVGRHLEKVGGLNRYTLPAERPHDRRPAPGGRTPAWVPQIIPGGG